MPFNNDWQGGFFCPCHGSMFDLAGRVFEGVPAPTNLEVPPHRYEGTCADSWRRSGDRIMSKLAELGAWVDSRMPMLKKRVE